MLTKMLLLFVQQRNNNHKSILLGIADTSRQFLMRSERSDVQFFSL